MAKKKLQRFAEMENFSNVIQPAFNHVYNQDFHLKNNWKIREFGNHNPIILELGCGKGEYTVGLARTINNANFIGVDIKGSRIWKGAKAAIEEKLENVRFLRTHIEIINSFFGTEEVDEIWITFPDPQLKKKRKRLTSSRFLLRYNQFLKPDGIIHLKTDNDVLFNYTLELAKCNNFEIIKQTTDLYRQGILVNIPDIKTFYERQFLEQGLKINYLSFKLPKNAEIQEPVDTE